LLALADLTAFAGKSVGNGGLPVVSILIRYLSHLTKLVSLEINS